MAKIYLKIDTKSLEEALESKVSPKGLASLGFFFPKLS
jgi:hypothetical protein